MFVEKYMKLRNLNIFTKKYGNGTPLLFLHGGPGGEHRYFLPHLQELSDRFQLIFYDQRGCGLSEEPQDKNYTMDEEVETLEALRVELGIEKVNLIGESWGSMLALLYACKYPQHVNKIFLTAAVGAVIDGYLNFEKELLSRMTEKDKHELEELTPKLEHGEVSVNEIFRIIDPYYLFSSKNLHKKTPTKSNAEVNRIMGNDIVNHYDLSGKMDQLSEIPILVAQGDHDMITPEKLPDLLLKFIPHAQLKVIKDCGHWSVIEKPDVLQEYITEFF
ncbi:alpha/beta fold hydrolase [Heyndrickxia sp. NPDC080065]|uniref:alpha/beta fold hydrolase n=1 Tax=Heyndrickxia sp. NPDC080065 TaxID=3390568 RepID=UPI003D07AC72